MRTSDSRVPRERITSQVKSSQVCANKNAVAARGGPSSGPPAPAPARAAGGPHSLPLPGRPLLGRARHGRPHAPAAASRAAAPFGGLLFTQYQQATRTANRSYNSRRNITQCGRASQRRTVSGWHVRQSAVRPGARGMSAEMEDVHPVRIDPSPRASRDRIHARDGGAARLGRGLLVKVVPLVVVKVAPARGQAG